MTSKSTYSESSEDEEFVHGPHHVVSSPVSDPSSSKTVPNMETGSYIILHGSEPVFGQVRLALRQVALRQIEGHCVSDLNRELGGVLLGHAKEIGESLWIEVIAAIPANSEDHGPVHFKFTADTWAKLHEDRTKRYPNLDIVGWFHTHPNLGVFYSADDVIVHSAAFTMPWHVGLVLDPVRSEGFLVGWFKESSDSSNLSLVGINGFYELLDEQQDSVISWNLVESSVWHQGGYYYQDNELSEQVFAPVNDWPSLPAISPWWGVIIGGLGLLISLLLLLDRLLAGAQ